MQTIDNKKNHLLKIALICGGPSLERGISLNSARSCLDHLETESIQIIPYYVDFYKNFYSIAKAQLYSNTPSDFDFKLAQMGTKLSESELIAKLKAADIVFPVIHGTFGEDGELQEFLEKHTIPFIGCGSKACHNMFDKGRAASLLRKNNFTTLPSLLLEINTVDNNNIHRKAIDNFFAKHNLKRAIIKPIAGGSSIGVFSVTTTAEALEKLKRIAAMRLFKQVIIEPFCEGTEFTTIVLENPNSEPVALIPTEIQVSYANGQIFDYRRKYLPTANTTWHCPPRFNDATVTTIRNEAVQIFKLFGMRDFARLDGWILNDGRIIFSDLNPISGMEQNSFIFQQSSRVGMSHRDLLQYVLKNATHRYNIDLPLSPNTKKPPHKPVYVLFGGKTSERQVSLMSGTNVWLKLLQSKTYEPTPFFLDKENNVWHLPYTYALNHTVEEIYENCITAPKSIDRLEKFVNVIRCELLLETKNTPQDAKSLNEGTIPFGFQSETRRKCSRSAQHTLTYVSSKASLGQSHSLKGEGYSAKDHLPTKISFTQFLKNTKTAQAFLFLGLHGGDGENGTIQKLLDKEQILYNGSHNIASAICMDKLLTGQIITNLLDQNITTVPKRAIKISDFVNLNSHSDYKSYWQGLVTELKSDAFIIKPQNSGCSSGIIRLANPSDLEKYVDLVKTKAKVILPGTLSTQTNIVEMELENAENFLIEAYIKTDPLRIENNKILYKKSTGFIECTVGVLETGGNYHALNPSITVAEGEVLTVEEKFQGGTGINITPPPEHIISDSGREKIKTGIAKIAKALGIKNYARIDIFFNTENERIYVIEANTLPALTPSTVIYHQALAEQPALYPLVFLEKIIGACGY